MRSIENQKALQGKSDFIKFFWIHKETEISRKTIYCCMYNTCRGPQARLYWPSGHTISFFASGKILKKELFSFDYLNTILRPYKSLYSQIPRETPMLRSGVWIPMAETSVENNIWTRLKMKLGLQSTIIFLRQLHITLNGSRTWPSPCAPKNYTQTAFWQRCQAQPFEADSSTRFLCKRYFKNN